VKDIFVTTDNVKRTLAALDPLCPALEQGLPPATGRGLVLLEGRTGTGKTMCCEWLATQLWYATYVRTMKLWNGPWMLEDLAAALGLAVRGSSKANLRNIVEELRRRPRLIILDEADRVVNNIRLLETIRDIYDTTKCPVALVSEGGGLAAIERRSPRTWRRLGQVVEYATLSARDVQQLWAELAEVQAPLSLEQAEQVLKHSQGGSIGEVMVTLEELERKVRANPERGLTPKVMELAFRRAV